MTVKKKKGALVVLGPLQTSPRLNKWIQLALQDSRREGGLGGAPSDVSFLFAGASAINVCRISPFKATGKFRGAAIPRSADRHQS